MKFTVEYKRTVRVRQYETLTIGWIEEFDKDEATPFEAFEIVKGLVNHMIEENLDELRKQDDATLTS